MKHLRYLFGLGVAALPISSAFADIKSQTLHNKQFLWDGLEQVISESHFQHGIAPTRETELLSTVQKAHNVHYKLTKRTGASTTYEHYRAYVGNYPVLSSNLVIIRNKNGKIRQAMGNLISGTLPQGQARFHNMADVQLSQHIEAQPGLNGVTKYSYKKAFLLKSDTLIPVVEVLATFKDRKEKILLDGNELAVLSTSYNMSFAFSQESLTSAGYVAGGGIGGNDKMGAICYSPSPGSMQNCTSYQFDDIAPVGAELRFEDSDPSAIFSEFNGYPFVVKKEGNNCILDNPYVVTYDAAVSEVTPVAYTCQSNNENFVKQQIDQTFNAYYSYSPANEAHFNAGLVMQYFHNQLKTLYPQQSQDCDSSGYCIKSLSQKVNRNTIFGTNSASWDGEFVNYGSGNGGYEYFALTGMSIAAHEIAHAITEWNSGLGRENVDSAINEGLSDIAAIAILDYYQHTASGAYTQSQAFTDQFREQAGLYTKNRKWWYGWDVFPQDKAARFFELPSWDGRSIDHVKDYTTAKTGHDNGGVLRKAFYELVKTQGWTIQQAYRLFLRANTSGCLFSGMSLNEFGFCLIDQTPHIQVGNKSESQIKTDVSLSLAGVGISTDIGLSTLDADVWLNYNQASYDLSRIDQDSIRNIEVNWGDGQTDSWQRDSNTPIYPFIQRSSQVVEDTLIRFSVNVTTEDQNGSQATQSAYHHFYSRPAAMRCEPYMNNAVLHTSTVSINNNTLSGLNAGYRANLDTPWPVAKPREHTLSFSQDLSGKLVSVYFDYNKNGLMESNEALLSNQNITGNSTTFTLDQSASAGLGLLRIAITSNDTDYSFLDACGVVDHGQVVDIMLDVDSKNLPLISDFDIQYLEGNRVKFTNTSQVNDAKSPQFFWQFGFDNRTSTARDPGIIDYPANGGQFDVSLQIQYADHSEADTKQTRISLDPANTCPAKISDGSNADVIYIDDMKLFNYSTLIANVPAATGFNRDGYSLNTLSGTDIKRRTYISVEIMTNLMPRSTAENLLQNGNRDVRFTIWLDADGNDEFTPSESGLDNDPNYNYWIDNSQCTTISGSEYCRISATKSLTLPNVSTWDWSKWFVLRSKLEEGPANEYKSDACNRFNYGEIEDLKIKVTRY
ncbi:M4 family metallopeptidase [Pseudoalteromonas sp. OOF1S-7]|uniref:M4 family metallopeptidase n=1 Tax=Pseudoalteromonas sp. OOF1S-7 TaxID=2917757 RepID=UPI001EF51614|nr:M4 family metallopeptidase [Pseudoalteromonas sp. OOF1S-7]MCG7537268.1 M4 family metallopeptidase [Pseudoalteromonas sp. OOF1S-7]